MPKGSNKGLGSYARSLAQAPNRTGGIGKQVSAAAKAKPRPTRPAKSKGK